MQMQIDLTDLQKERLVRITKAYMERGLIYPLDDMMSIILRTHMHEYIDQMLEKQETIFFPQITGRVKGRWEETKS